jgi:Ca-activated chloride channel family protein
MRGFGFSQFKPNQIPKGGFEELLKLFLELLELYRR